jgi:hypothetical protein
MANDQETFKQLIELAEHPVIRDFYHHAQAIAGFSLPPSIKVLFENHHHHCFDEPCPDFTKGWGPESANWKWQKLHNESILGSAQSATAAVFYHCENLRRMEREVLSFRDIDLLIPLMSQSTIGGGNTQKLDFEYHAFIFAYRRTLDYLSRGVAALVKEECKSYNKLPTSLQNHSKKPWIRQITDIHSKYASRLETFVHPARGHSTRDKITHFLHVPAGCLNVNAQGIFFAGGGENLQSSNRLGDVINEHVHTLREVLAECFSSMATGMPKNAA